MKITPFDGVVTSYLVDSEFVEGMQYLVDLTFYGGIGKCSCPYHTYNKHMAPWLHIPGNIAIAQKSVQEADLHRCKHIMAVRDLLGPQLIDTVVHKHNQEDKLLKAQMNQPKRIGY